jgi:hypothetical protein
MYHCIAFLHISVIVWAGFLLRYLEPYYFNAVTSASGQFVHFKSGMLQVKIINGIRNLTLAA